MKQTSIIWNGSSNKSYTYGPTVRLACSLYTDLTLLLLVEYLVGAGQGEYALISLPIACLAGCFRRTTQVGRYTMSLLFIRSNKMGVPKQWVPAACFSVEKRALAACLSQAGMTTSMRGTIISGRSAICHHLLLTSKWPEYISRLHFVLFFFLLMQRMMACVYVCIPWFLVQTLIGLRGRAGEHTHVPDETT